MINTILIIEDEKLNADRLIRLIGQMLPHAEIAAVLESIEDSVTWLSNNPAPDVIMMDVRLSDGISFEIFDRVAVPGPVIFTTAYDEYALRAFKYNSIDYLLKPVDAGELAAAINKLEAVTPEQPKVSWEVLSDFLQPKEFRSRFLLPFRDGYKTLQVNDILYFYSELKITRARLADGKEEVVPQTLEELELQLNPKQFFRANRQFIVHIDAIKHVHNHFNGKLKLDIRNNPDTEVLVSRDKAQLLKSWMDF